MKLLATYMGISGYVTELLDPENVQVVCAGGFYSELTGKDGPVVRVRRPTKDGFGEWVEHFFDKLEWVDGTTHGTAIGWVGGGNG